MSHFPQPKETWVFFDEKGTRSSDVYPSRTRAIRDFYYIDEYDNAWRWGVLKQRGWKLVAFSE